MWSAWRFPLMSKAQIPTVRGYISRLERPIPGDSCAVTSNYFMVNSDVPISRFMDGRSGRDSFSE